MSSETALAAREARLAKRESAMRHHQMIVHKDEEIEKVRDREKGLLRRTAEQPAVDSLAEFGGTFAEALVKKEAPAAHPFTGPAALALELASLFMLHKNPRASEWRTVASIARGAQARSRVQIADSAVAAIFT